MYGDSFLRTLLSSVQGTDMKMFKGNTILKILLTGSCLEFKLHDLRDHSVKMGHTLRILGSLNLYFFKA
jgi:hypothetical protein